MKTIIPLLLLITLAGCSDSSSAGKDIRHGYKVVEIDNCEYIVYAEGAGSNKIVTFTHKGNCKFCEERKCKK